MTSPNFTPNVCSREIFFGIEKVNYEPGVARKIIDIICAIFTSQPSSLTQERIQLHKEINTAIITAYQSDQSDRGELVIKIRGNEFVLKNEPEGISVRLNAPNEDPTIISMTAGKTIAEWYTECCLQRNDIRPFLTEKMSSSNVYQLVAHTLNCHGYEVNNSTTVLRKGKTAISLFPIETEFKDLTTTVDKLRKEHTRYLNNNGGIEGTVVAILNLKNAPEIIGKTSHFVTVVIPTNSDISPKIIDSKSIIKYPDNFSVRYTRQQQFQDNSSCGPFAAREVTYILLCLDAGIAINNIPHCPEWQSPFIENSIDAEKFMVAEQEPRLYEGEIYMSFK